MLRAISGRASVTVRQRDDALDEAHALKSELRQVGAALPSARALHRYVTVVGDSIEAEQHAARIYYLLGRVQRRHGPGEAA